MDFEDIYEVRQTNEEPCQYQFWEKANNKLLCTCPSLGPLMLVASALRLKLLWNQLKEY
jgi:hypothetical protein